MPLEGHPATKTTEDGAGAASLGPGPASGCLAVLIPVFDEAPTVDTVLARVLAQPFVVEVVIVDDGSRDRTWEHLNGWPVRDARVKVLRHVTNHGKGAAVRTGLAHITAKWVVIQDADLEYDPADYERMLEPLLKNEADVVYGSRFQSRRVATPAWHRFINWSLTMLANSATGLRLTDMHTCLKMFPTELLKALALEETRFGFCPEVTAKLASIPGLRLAEVPVAYQRRSRSAGKKIGIRDGLRAVYCVIKYSRSPLVMRGADQRGEEACAFTARAR